MKVYLTSLAIIALIAVAGFRIASPGGLMGFKYESTAVVQVHPSMIAITTPPGKSPIAGTLMSRNYMESEFETIISDQTLTSALEAIDLDTRWDLSEEETLEALREMVSTNPRRGTDFIEIKARRHTRGGQSLSRKRSPSHLRASLTDLLHASRCRGFRRRETKGRQDRP